ncbi:MAG: hypothetical protein D6683_04015 [Actinomyces sp.]|nr:MAG: hypothetical protein D6683_04015 [Actinomyces sp.]
MAISRTPRRGRFEAAAMGPARIAAIERGLAGLPADDPAVLAADTIVDLAISVGAGADAIAAEDHALRFLDTDNEIRSHHAEMWNVIAVRGMRRLAESASTMSAVERRRLRTEACQAWNESVRQATMARAQVDGGNWVLMWVAERDACPVCLPLSGTMSLGISPNSGNMGGFFAIGRDEVTWDPKTIPAPPPAVSVNPWRVPKDDRHVALISSPPRHWNCRCHTIPMIGESSVHELSEALKREAARSAALMAWEEDPSMSRVRAAQHVLSRDPNLPPTVIARAISRLRSVKRRKAKTRKRPTARFRIATDTPLPDPESSFADRDPRDGPFPWVPHPTKTSTGVDVDAPVPDADAFVVPSDVEGWLRWKWGRMPTGRPRMFDLPPGITVETARSIAEGFDDMMRRYPMLRWGVSGIAVGSDYGATLAYWTPPENYVKPWGFTWQGPQPIFICPSPAQRGNGFADGNYTVVEDWAGILHHEMGHAVDSMIRAIEGAISDTATRHDSAAAQNLGNRFRFSFNLPTTSLIDVATIRALRRRFGDDPANWPEFKDYNYPRPLFRGTSTWGTFDASPLPMGWTSIYAADTASRTEQFAELVAIGMLDRDEFISRFRDDWSQSTSRSELDPDMDPTVTWEVARTLIDEVIPEYLRVAEGLGVDPTVAIPEVVADIDIVNSWGPITDARNARSDAIAGWLRSHAQLGDVSSSRDQGAPRNVDSPPEDVMLAHAMLTGELADIGADHLADRGPAGASLAEALQALRYRWPGITDRLRRLILGGEEGPSS